jgi:hypothetical protein
MQSVDFNQKLSHQILELEEHFNEETEYKFSRMLELLEKDWKAGDYDIQSTSDGLLWQGQIDR